MLDINQRKRIRAMADAGIAVKKIARTLEISRNTVRRWIRNQENASKRFGKCQAFLQEHSEEIREQFISCEGHCVPLQRQIQEKFGTDVGLRTLQRFCKTFRHELKENPARTRFETPPGKQLQIDFGEKVIMLGGKGVRIHFFVAVLGYSRRIYVKAFSAENTACWLNGIESSFRYFESIPCEIVSDNTRCLIKEHRVHNHAVPIDRYKSFCDYWNVTPVACSLFYPQSKGKVERAVRYVKENALQGKTFETLKDLNFWLEKWCREFSDKRKLADLGLMNPQERFLIEQGYMRRCQQLGIADVIEVNRQVSATGLIRIDGEFYRVPDTLINKEVQVLHDDRSITVSRKGIPVIELDKRTSVYKPRQPQQQINAKEFEKYWKNPLQRSVDAYESALGGRWS